MPECNLERCSAVTEIINSVAKEQMALSCIINAESEKLKMVIERNEEHFNPEILLKVNKSVQDMIITITKLEMVLENKLELFKECLCEKCNEHNS